MNVICLVIDRLHAGYLGAYGNTWIKTPAFDRLAAESFVFDHALVDSPRLDLLYRSYWQGLHALYARKHPPERQSLGAALRGKGVQTTLLTDDPAVARHPLVEDFDELVALDPPWQPEVAAEVEQTHLAKCFVEAIERLETAESPFLLWSHFGGLGTTWDAPPDLRDAYREEGDPDPYASAEPPDRKLAEHFDPDEAFSVVQAYAGQITLLDACLAVLLEFLDASDLAQNTALIVTSSRGFPLGEHHRLGPCDEALYGEIVQVPLLLRMPDGTGQAARSQALIEPSDLWATVLDLCGVSGPYDSPTGGNLLPLVREERLALRDRLCVQGSSGDRAIRTPAWYLRTAAAPELFTKPDDRWEVNNVASRCQDVVELLVDAITEFDQAIQHGHAADLSPLPGVLMDGLG